MKRKNWMKDHGLTLMELLIAIAIIVILTAIAVPTYLHYTKKAYYSEVVETANHYKAAVVTCIKERKGVLTDCNAGQYGIPPNITSGVGQISSVIVTNSVITVTPTPIHGITVTETYTLTPTYNQNEIIWRASGGGCTAGLAPNC